MPRRSTALVRYDRSHPTTVEELEARRSTKAKLSLIDQAEALHKFMLAHPNETIRDEYLKYNKADFHNEAIEEDVNDDRVRAAIIARQAARDAGNDFMGTLSTSKLRHALNRAKSRFDESTNKRRLARTAEADPYRVSILPEDDREDTLEDVLGPNTEANAA